MGRIHSMEVQVIIDGIKIGIAFDIDEDVSQTEQGLLVLFKMLMDTTIEVSETFIVEKWRQ